MTPPGGDPQLARPPGAAPTVVDWSSRYEHLTARLDELDAAELDELGLAAWFLGREDECERAWEAGQRAYLAAGDTDAAVRCVFWLGFTLGEHGQTVKARAWMTRLFELCAAGDGSARTAAAAALCEAVAAATNGNAEASVAAGARAAELARAAGDHDLETLATMWQGRALIGLGRVEAGFACMDRVMLAIGEGLVGDRAAGPAYCAVIVSCLERWDVERARTWTRELSDWCDAQRGLEPFRGECSVNRATVLRIGGEWPAAAEALGEVVERERRPETRENAIYALAELDRLAGRTEAAEAGYRRAAELGRDAQPGLALLLRDTGRTASARRGLARSLESAPPPGRRAELLAARVEIEAAAGDLATARAAATELRDLADSLRTRYLTALADRADATVRLAEGDAAAALPLLRRAWSAWRELEAPYEAALTRALLGRAARELGDEDGAQLEFDAARGALADLGAVPDLARLERLASAARAAPGGLSPRELEVLRLVAGGASNRDIANRLFLSERTVARHVGNILAKLGLANRSSATAYAFEHGLVGAS
ncbi:LuxR C-terminal-related transcriptional regulator [Agromyces soli]